MINLISKTGVVEGGTTASNLGLDYERSRLDFDYGTRLSDSLRMNIGGFYRQGEGPRAVGFETQFEVRGWTLIDRFRYSEISVGFRVAEQPTKAPATTLDTQLGGPGGSGSLNLDGQGACQPTEVSWTEPRHQYDQYPTVFLSGITRAATMTFWP